jgi:hypothetical protein
LNRPLRVTTEGTTVRADGRWSFSFSACDPPGTADFAVWPVLPLAFAQQRPLVIERPVTAQTLFNANQMMRTIAFHTATRPLAVAAPTVSPADRRTVRAVLPFSGGADSCFTLFDALRQGRGGIEAVFVRGLDLGVGNRAGCEAAERRCRDILEPTGVPLRVVETDIREAVRLEWTWHNAFVLGGLVQLFQDTHSRGLISAEGDGGDLSVRDCFGGTGLPPFLNERLFPLFSSTNLSVDTWGHLVPKQAKINFLSRIEPVRRHLRTCWLTPDGGNCGTCRSCVLMQVGFVGSGTGVPPCYPVTAEPDHLRRIVAESEANPALRTKLLFRLHDFLTSADARGVSHPFVDIARGFLAGGPAAGPWDYRSGIAEWAHSHPTASSQDS